MKINIQEQYDKIYFYFSKTTETFDFLEWNGKMLKVWDKEVVVERYSLKDLREIVFI